MQASQPVGTGTTQTWARRIEVPLKRCAELRGVDLATICEAASTVEPYLRADGTRISSLTQLERQLRPEVYGRRRGGYLDRRQSPVTEHRTPTIRYVARSFERERPHPYQGYRVG